MIRGETVIGAIAGLIVGYVAWLVAISIGDDLSTVSRWSVAVLALSVLSGVWAAVWGRRLRRRRNYPLAAFVFALPLLPVLLTLGVLADTYL